MPRQLCDSCVSFPLSKGAQSRLSPKAAGPWSYREDSKMQYKGDGWLLCSEEWVDCKNQSLKTISYFSPGL